ncbi:MAG: hypothetical protein GX444_11790 [Myxococcales bacterium]|nr:hypothetical protein [Myxococcales bacterium]
MRAWAFLTALLLIVATFFACSSSGDDDNDSGASDDDDNDNDDNDDDDDDNNDDNDSVDDDDDDDDDDNDDDNDDNDNDDDNDDNDDTYVPPSPVYGYYQEGGPGSWDWLTAQLPVFAADGLTLFLGIMDTDLGTDGLRDFLLAAQTAGVEVRAWVLLPYEDGYWANEMNAEKFAAEALAYADWFAAEGLPVEWIVVDMEMDINRINQLNQYVQNGQYLEALTLLLANWNPERFAFAVDVYAQLVADLNERGFRTMVVTYPIVLDDLADGDASLQDLLDVPISGVPWHEVSTMVYSSTYEEYLPLDFTAYFAYDYARATVEYFGDRASIALGVSGQMTDPQVLADEIAASKAAGVERIQVYSYAGSAGHADPDLWHATFTAPAQTPPPDFPTWLVREGGRLVDELF